MNLRAILFFFLFFFFYYQSYAQDKLIFAEQPSESLYKCDLDGNNIEVVATGQQVVRRIRTDYENGIIYWIEGSSGKMWRIDMDGTNQVEILDVSSNNLNLIILDKVNDRILYTITNDGFIRSIDFDGSNNQIVVSGVGNVQGMDYDYNCDKIYWTEYDGGVVKRANGDGTNVETLITSNNQPFDLILDLANDKFYYSDRNTDKIHRANLNGTDLEDIISTPGDKGAMSFGTSNAKIYWVNNSSELIRSANLDGSGITTLISGFDLLAGIDVDLEDNITIPQNNFSLGNDTTICPGESMVLSFDDDAFVSTQWQNGNTGNSFDVTEAGMFWVLAETIGGCIVSDTIMVSLIEGGENILGNDTTLCEAESIVIGEEYADATYTWQDGTDNPFYTVVEAGEYWVEVDLGTGCMILDSIQIDYTPIESFSLGSDTTLCPMETITVGQILNNATYTWQDGTSQAFYTIDEAGDYWMTAVSDNGCFQSDTISVEFVELPNYSLGEDITFCVGDTITIGQELIGALYSWSDGTTTPFLSVETAGTYWLEVTTSDGCTLTDEINVFTTSSEEFNIGNDTTLCLGDELVVGIEFPGAIYTWQDGSFDSLYLINQEGVYWLNVELASCNFSDTILVDFFLPENLELGNDTTICEDEPIVLEAWQLGANYVWQDSTTLPYFEVNTTGLYSVQLSSNGCEYRDSVFVTALDCTICNVYIPNAFSPNGDGINDYFETYSNCNFQNYNLKIFDRWGEFVFEGKTESSRWDGTFKGKEMQTGLYVYLLEFTYANGQDFNKHVQSGGVTLLK